MKSFFCCFQPSVVVPAVKTENVIDILTNRAMVLYERYVPLRERIHSSLTRQDVYNYLARHTKFSR